MSDTSTKIEGYTSAEGIPVPTTDVTCTSRTRQSLVFVGLAPVLTTVADHGELPMDDRDGWVQVVVGHLVLFNTWGYINSYGLFLSYYSTHLPSTSLSDLSWVGSVQIFLLFFIGTFSGRMFDAGYYRLALVAGSVLQLLGIFMTSLATEYWQLFLAQGVCGGIGAGIIYCPAVACVATYFDKKRALAMALITSGTATGGVIFPVIAQQLLPKVGFAWTVRVMAFVVLFNVAVILSFGRTRLPPRSNGPIFELQAFLEAPYSLFTAGVFLCLWAVYIGYDYISQYATFEIKTSASTSLIVLLILNAMGCPGRIFPALISDAYVGPFKTLIPIVVASSVLYFCWIAVSSIAGLYTFVVFFGLINGGVQGMILAGLPSLTTDLSKMGTRSGMVLSVVSFSVLTGPPLAGELIRRDEGDYLYLQIWGGCSMLVGACFLIAARLAAGKG